MAKGAASKEAKPPKVTGKSGRGGDKKPRSKSYKAGLQFPVSRIGRFLKQGKFATRVGQGASVYLGTFSYFKISYSLAFHMMKC